MVALRNISDVLYLNHSTTVDKRSPSYLTIHFDCSLAEFQNAPVQSKAFEIHFCIATKIDMSWEWMLPVFLFTRQPVLSSIM